MSFKRRAVSTTCVIASSIVLAGTSISAATAQSSFPSGSSGFPLSSSSSAGPAEPTAPKNIIYMVGDGMGFNHVAATNLYESGQTRYQVEGEPGSVKPVEGGDAVQAYEAPEWNQVSMSTFQDGNSYDPTRAWADHNYVNESFTDSAAAGTAMATGAKTKNGMIGVNPAGDTLKNTSEHAIDNGKSAGVVTSVPFNHATPAAWAAHNSDRNDYHGMAKDMLDSDLDVIMGGGHPLYTDDNQLDETPDYSWIAEDTFNSLSAGETDFTYFDEDSSFEVLANGEVDPEKQYFGLAQVRETLQHNRSGESVTPYDTALNDVVDLATMSKGALNVLNQDPDGFQVMIEGGAIDWAGHANDIARDIEEVQAFNSAVDAVVDWVETNSSWEETLVIITADHETGYLTGDNDDPKWSAMTGATGTVPNHEWHSGNHTNQLVPVFFRGPGSTDIIDAATGTDALRGSYLDNVDIANLTINRWW